MNKMEEIRIEKLTLNIGVGAPGEKLDKAIQLLTHISGSKPVETTTKKRIPNWSLRPKLKIACKVTLRKKKAYALLAKLLKSRGNNLKLSNFDETGNLSFGIPEYIDIPGLDYKPEIGMYGLDVAVTLSRPGFRIKERSRFRKKLPTKVKIRKEEAVDFIKKEFGVVIQ